MSDSEMLLTANRFLYAQATQGLMLLLDTSWPDRSFAAYHVEVFKFRTLPEIERLHMVATSDEKCWSCPRLGICNSDSAACVGCTLRDTKCTAWPSADSLEKFIRLQTLSTMGLVLQQLVSALDGPVRARETALTLPGSENAEETGRVCMQIAEIVNIITGGSNRRPGQESRRQSWP
ncbi:hypothetical protein LTS08_008761 [Lithohypha guttulata]|uniref:Uncharacterized protein n=1 Tax=Lithohypha guttulata TaxID=1690604 RepID=A0AAN7SRV1_9EURO|nr:hypothetical protein LTR05_008754 [Lithohypha guttulata]KAK5094078.1 hypothetical protein LTS08_008761 [Lithohypha guttulata]